jgi:pilus assembly protein Flp/PilA
MTSLFAHLFALTVTTKERLTSEDRGATAVEYGLLVGLIAIAIIVAVTSLSTSLQGLFTGAANAI